MTDIKYILGHNPMFPVYRKAKASLGPAAVGDETYLEMAEGIYNIGYEGQGFSFDNECAPHKVYLEGYRILDRLVTNGEYLEFMEDGGYQQFAHWLSEGWEWVQGEERDSPMYWHKIEEKWHHYTLGGLRPVNPDEPVTHISYFEADAFAAWKGKRLPTEQEWEAAAKRYSPVIAESANVCPAEWYHPRIRQGDYYQFFGDVWEWTQSAYLPYPRYSRAPGALGEYNGKFMINQMVLRGGSCATPEDHVRHTYRNFFHPHLSWQFTGIRLAETF